MNITLFTINDFYSLLRKNYNALNYRDKVFGGTLLMSLYGMSHHE